MSRVVWKFELVDLLMRITDAVTMPRGSALLYVGVDPAGVPCVWALCNPDAEQAPRRLDVCETGGTPSHGCYVGSFVAGRYVGHLFDGGDS